MSFATIEPFLIVLIPIILPPLIALCGAWYQSLVQKLPLATRDQLQNVARTVVPAVEQIASAQLNGPGKKQLALQQAAQILAHLGIKNVNPDVLSSFIEEAVYAINTAKSAPTVVEQKLPLAQG